MKPLLFPNGLIDKICDRYSFQDSSLFLFAQTRQNLSILIHQVYLYLLDNIVNKYETILSSTCNQSFT